jgi:hypothetical protein
LADDPVEWGDDVAVLRPDGDESPICCGKSAVSRSLTRIFSGDSLLFHRFGGTL